MLELHDNFIGSLVGHYLGERVETAVRFKNGLSHRVFDIQTADGQQVVLKVATPERGEELNAGVYWYRTLAPLGIPVPTVIANGTHEELPFMLTSRLPGDDLELVYEHLMPDERADLAKAMVVIQQKIAALPVTTLKMVTPLPWSQIVELVLNRSERGMAQNQIFDMVWVKRFRACLESFMDYLAEVTAVPFFYDLNVRNVMVSDGKLSGIIDLDSIWLGDWLLALGHGQIHLLLKQQPTDYIDVWIDALALNPTERRAVTLYTMLYCLRSMSLCGVPLNGNQNVMNDQNSASLLPEITERVWHQLLEEQ